MMKKTAILLATGLMMAVMPSCSDSDLDIENGNSLNTSNFWKTEEDAEKGLVAVYNMFYRQGTWTRNIYTQLNGMADDGVSYAGWSELAEYS
ncbi:MAG: RagB/SusD family nutrient uptake outer membrane protein, partial [Muribaculaceae bacterium]